MPTRTTILTGAPCWIDLFTSDVAAAKAFYGGLFGWTAEESGPEYGGYVTFSRGGVVVAGCLANDGAQGAPDMWTTYFAVDDVAATVAAAAGRGGEVYLDGMEVPQMGVMAMLGDPGGATVGLWNAAGHTGFGVVDGAGVPAWFELHTRAYDESIMFYEKVLDWAIDVVSDDADLRYTTLRRDDEQAVGIMDASAFLPEGVPARWSIYFGTDDVATSLARAVELGGSIVDAAADTPDGRLATIADPTGTQIKLRGPTGA